MSNAASTVPAKRNVFRTKPPKIPSLDDKPKKESKIKKNSKRGNADVLIVKHKDTKTSNTLQDDSDHGHFEDEETWMEKTNHVLQSGLDNLDPVTSGHTEHRKGNQLNAVNNVVLDESRKGTIKIMHVENYENFMEERKQLLQLNEKYEKRIAGLEHEVARVLEEFAKLYEDNEKLRRKMDTGKDPLLEPYSRVFEDRKILREAESGYKRRIIRLEEEIKEKQNECEKFQDAVKALKSKVKPTSKAENKGRKTEEMKYQVELKKLKTENETLRSNIKDLETFECKPDLLKIKSENDTLKSIIRKLEIQLSRNAVSENKSPTSRKDEPKPRSRTKPHQVTFGDKKPIIFDYEYLLPDSQVYD